MITLIEEKEAWSSLVAQCNLYDFYHTFEYHQLSIEKDSFRLIKFDSDDILILFPVVIRNIADSEYFDITSVYGYPGPITNIPIDKIPVQVIKQFNQELARLFIDLKIITCFSRLHTLIDQEHFFFEIGKVKPLNKTIFIDLTLPLEVQRAQYGRSTKYQINKLRKDGFITRIAISETDLDAYIQIYYSTMDRVNAKKEYYFSKEYFQQLLAAKEFEVFILLAEKEGEVAAAAMFTICNQFMQYHLGGTAEKFLSNAPFKLIVDEARLIANEKKLAAFNLGGGYGGEDDSLLKFKLCFSQNISVFKVWNHIANEKVYEDLVSQKFGDTIPQANYFPLYRFSQVKINEMIVDER